MEWWLLSFFLGAILSLFLPVVPDISLLLLILAVSLTLLPFKKFRQLNIFVIGACWLLISASEYQQALAKNNIVLEEQQKQTLIIRGEVVNIVHHQRNSHRFNFSVSHWQGKKLFEPLLIRLSWKKPSNKLLQGQQWQLAVKLKPVHGLANIGGFNYQVWLQQKKINATGYVKSDTVKSIEKLGQKNNVLLLENVSWRQKLYQQVAVLLKDKPHGSLILALGFGERGELTSQQWQTLSATATVHLIAISGLHIGIVAFFSFSIVRALLKFIPLTLLCSSNAAIKLMSVNVKYIPIIISCSLAWYYAYLAGFSIPTLRALVMLFVFWLLKASAINVSLMRWFFLSILVILLCWPLSLLSASFWLSVSALSIIFATSSRFLHKGKQLTKPVTTSPQNGADITEEMQHSSRWLKTKYHIIYWCKGLVVMQLALTICMLPIAATLTYELPLLAFFANVIAVPLMSVTTIPLTLLGVIMAPINETLSMFFLHLAHVSLDMVWRWLSYIAEIQWAQISVSNNQLNLLFLIVFVSFFVLYFRLQRSLSIVVTLLFVSLVPIAVMTEPSNKHWQLSVLDVGHGLAVVIEKNNHVFIYDTGARYPSGFNMAEAAILPYLKYQGYSAIDGVIISHNDNDHAGSLPYLREKMPIEYVVANDIALKPNAHCLLGKSFIWQGLHLDMLSPSEVKGDKNDDSCVIVISDGIHKVLLPGDISVKQEKRLLKSSDISKKLRSDVLIAPHHGSKSSSNAAFLSAVAPTYAIFSAGYLNRWQMPSAQIQRRYNEQNIETFNTAEHGMVTFIFTPLSIEPTSYRQNFKPYWFVN